MICCGEKGVGAHASCTGNFLDNAVTTASVNKESRSVSSDSRGNYRFKFL